MSHNTSATPTLDPDVDPFPTIEDIYPIYHHAVSHSKTYHICFVAALLLWLIGVIWLESSVPRPNNFRHFIRPTGVVFFLWSAMFLFE